MRGVVWRRFADEVLQEFGLVGLGGSGRSRSAVGRDPVGFVSDVLLLEPTLLPHVFGLPTQRAAGVGAEACMAENTQGRAELLRCAAKTG